MAIARFLLFVLCMVSIVEAGPLKRGRATSSQTTFYSDSVVDSPDDVAGLVLWLRADEAYTDTDCTALAGDTDSVACLKDKSSSGYNFTQATAANQPTLDAVDTNFNSRPSVFFDNTDLQSSSDYLTGSASLKYSHTQAFTLIVVYRVVATNENPTLFSYMLATGDLTGFALIGIGGGTNLAWMQRDVGSTKLDLRVSNELEASDIRILAYRSTTAFGASSVDLRLDNVETSLTTNTDGLAGGSDILTGTPVPCIGGYDCAVTDQEAAKYFDGNIAELVIFAGSVATGDMNSLHANYFCDRYSRC